MAAALDWAREQVGDLDGPPRAATRPTVVDGDPAAGAGRRRLAQVRRQRIGARAGPAGGAGGVDPPPHVLDADRRRSRPAARPPARRRSDPPRGRRGGVPRGVGGDAPQLRAAPARPRPARRRDARDGRPRRPARPPARTSSPSCSPTTTPCSPATPTDRPRGPGPHRRRPRRVRATCAGRSPTAASRRACSTTTCTTRTSSSSDNRFRFFDWGDASVSHPFVSLLIPLRAAASLARPRRRASRPVPPAGRLPQTSGATTAIRTAAGAGEPRARGRTVAAGPHLAAGAARCRAVRAGGVGGQRAGVDGRAPGTGQPQHGVTTVGLAVRRSAVHLPERPPLDRECAGRKSFGTGTASPLSFPRCDDSALPTTSSVQGDAPLRRSRQGRFHARGDRQ